MADVDHLRLDGVEDRREAPVDGGLPVPVPVPRVVDEVETDAGVRRVPLLPQPEVGREAVLLAGEDVDLVAPLGEPVAQCLGVDLGAGVVPHGVAVDDLEDLHRGIAGAVREWGEGGTQP